MKALFCLFIGLLLLANVALLFKQSRIEDRLQRLQTENAQLAHELALRPAVSEADLERTQAHIQRSAAILRATEERLTNAAATLATLEAAASQYRTRNNGSPLRSTRTPVEVTTGFVDLAPEPLGLPSTPITLVQSSSHTPDGQLLRRSWGPEQVLGPPDTHSAGDIPTAWAPLSSQGAGEEWLHVNYDRAVDIAEINVRETHNPGAISKVAAVMGDGREVIVWEGTEPPGEPPLNMTFRVPNGIQAQSVKVYMDRTRVPGWNEIDAIELVARDGTRQWASSAKASSSYAEPRAPSPTIIER